MNRLAMNSTVFWPMLRAWVAMNWPARDSAVVSVRRKASKSTRPSRVSCWVTQSGRAMKTLWKNCSGSICPDSSCA